MHVHSERRATGLGADVREHRNDQLQEANPGVTSAGCITIDRDSGKHPLSQVGQGDCIDGVLQYIFDEPMALELIEHFLGNGYIGPASSSI